MHGFITIIIIETKLATEMKDRHSHSFYAGSAVQVSPAEKRRKDKPRPGNARCKLRTDLAISCVGAAYPSSGHTPFDVRIVPCYSAV